jgi:hypothetical protein
MEAERAQTPARTAADLADHVARSFALADARLSRLGAAALEMEGMSGAATRHLYNNLCALPGGCSCLQIGVWKGSSVVAALSGNPGCRVTAVDCWSEFGGPRDEFLAVCEQLLSEDERAQMQVGRWRFSAGRSCARLARVPRAAGGHAARVKQELGKLVPALPGPRNLNSVG